MKIAVITQVMYFQLYVHVRVHVHTTLPNEKRMRRRSVVDMVVCRLDDFHVRHEHTGKHIQTHTHGMGILNDIERIQLYNIYSAQRRRVSVCEGVLLQVYRA